MWDKQSQPIWYLDSANFLGKRTPDLKPDGQNMMFLYITSTGKFEYELFDLQLLTSGTCQCFPTQCHDLQR